MPVLFLLMALFGQAASGGSDSDRQPAVVVATVDGSLILRGEVDRELTALLRNKTLAAADRARLEAHVLDQLIDRRLVLGYLKSRGEAVSPQLVAAEIEARQAQLQQQKISWKDYLQNLGISESAWRTDVEWRMSWKAYVDRRITDEVLQRHFDRNRRQFDGTQLSVRQILLAADPADDGKEATKVVERAQQIRREILDGKITFADAVARYSTGPSRREGGQLGFIGRQGPMDEPFSAAAFALGKKEISPPLVTRFGVHLIQCLEIKPGTKTWTEVVDALRKAVIHHGFQQIVSQTRPQAQIEFTGQGPYLDPDSGQLVQPPTPPR